MNPTIRVETYVGTADKLVEKEACRVYWIVASPAGVGTAGTLRVRDGFNTNAVEKFRMEAGYTRTSLFSPPFFCAHGLYVDIDANIGSYTIGFLPESVAAPLDRD